MKQYDKETKTTIQKFCFPEYGVVFEAKNIEEANKLLKDYLSPKTNIGANK